MFIITGRNKIRPIQFCYLIVKNYISYCEQSRSIHLLISNNNIKRTFYFHIANIIVFYFSVDLLELTWMSITQWQISCAICPDGTFSQTSSTIGGQYSIGTSKGTSTSTSLHTSLGSSLQIVSVIVRKDGIHFFLGILVQWGTSTWWGISTGTLWHLRSILTWQLGP